jgi:hypothetical protein
MEKDENGKKKESRKKIWSMKEGFGKCRKIVSKRQASQTEYE